MDAACFLQLPLKSPLRSLTNEVCSLPFPRGPAANGKLLSIMRVNNDVLCDLAALVEFDDAPLRPAGAGIGAAGANGTAGQLAGRFLRYTFVPGLGVGHPAVLYDEVRGSSPALPWGRPCSALGAAPLCPALGAALPWARVQPHGLCSQRHVLPAEVTTGDACWRQPTARLAAPAGPYPRPAY